jgi:hypothetical protein
MSALPLIATVKADMPQMVMSALPPESGHLETTQNDIKSGRMNSVVGFALLKPAEFVNIRRSAVPGFAKVLQRGRATIGADHQSHRDFADYYRRIELDLGPTNACYVRFGSKADMCATRDVRFTPESDAECVIRRLECPIALYPRGRGQWESRGVRGFISANGSASHRISMIGALVRPIPIGIR